MMKKLALSLVGFVGVVGVASAAHIDFFSDTQQVIDMTVGDGPMTDTALAIAGGGGNPDRTITVDLVSSIAGGNGSSRVNDAANDLLSLNSGAGTTAVWTIGYDYSNTTTTTIDLVNNAAGPNWDALRLDGVQNNRNTIDVFVTVTDSIGNMATNSIMNLPQFTGGMEFFLSYADFANSAATDFTSVSNILFTVDGQDSTLGADLLLDSVFRATQAVPVPASLLLLLVGALTMRARKQV